MQTVSPAELYDAIVAASSQDFTQVQASSQRLKQLVDTFGAYDTLQEIAARRDIDLAVRKQAIIQFKNAVINHWRSKKCVLGLFSRRFLHDFFRLLSDDHRNRIRQRCLSFVDEDVEMASPAKPAIFSKIYRILRLHSAMNL